MEFTRETLIVAIFAILPGFVSSGVRSQLDASKRSSAGEWVGGSIVTSLFLNAFAICVFAILTDTLASNVDLSQGVADVARQLGVISSWRALEYLVLLYALAIVWGVLSGVFGARYGQELLGHRLRLSPVTGATNTFTDVLDGLVHTRANLRLRGKPTQQVPWLRVLRSDAVILGRLRNSSEKFELSEAFEIFFSRAYVFRDGNIMAGEPAVPFNQYLRGLYLRVRPEDMVEVLVTPADWDPFPPATLSGAREPYPL